MKKVLFLFAFLLLGIGAMAQKVIYDETNQTGVRTVVCEGMNLGVSNNMDVYVALAGFQYKSTIRYSLAVTIGSGHEVEIPNDSKCVLTLDNGKALELPTVAGGASVLQHVDVEMSDVYQSFRRFAYYNIKAKELKKNRQKRYRTNGYTVISRKLFHCIQPGCLGKYADRFYVINK